MSKIAKSRFLYENLHFRFPLSFLVALIAVALVHKNMLLSKFLPGDSYDARANLVIYEHWNSFFHGHRSFLDIPVFYPASNMLGGSDANFTQGLIFTIFRSFNFDLTSSLKATVVVVTLLGLWGTSKLAFRLFDSKPLAIIAIFLAATSYQLFVQSNHLQTWMYLNLSWVILSLLMLVKREHVFFAFGVLVIGVPVLALSTWYCVVAIFYFGFTYLVFMMIFDSSSLSKLVIEVKQIFKLLLEKKSKMFIIILIGLVLSFLFLYIYLPKVGNTSFGNWSEVSFYLPRFSDLINASIGSNGIMQDLYSKMKLDIFPTSERAMGLTLSVLLLLTIGGVVLILKKLKLHIWVKSLYAASLVTLILPLTDERGLSFWYFVNQFPFMNSVRTPARFWVFSSIIISWISLWIIWSGFQLAMKSLVSKLSFFGLLTVLVILQVKEPIASWTETELLSPYGQTSAKLIEQNRCDYFYVSSSPELGLMESITIQIDAMIIASVQERKTINGYTSAPPPYWPQRPIWGLVGERDLKTWLRIYSGKFPGKLCFVDENGLKILTDKSH
jgi:hypothetical protein